MLRSVGWEFSKYVCVTIILVEAVDSAAKSSTARTTSDCVSQALFGKETWLTIKPFLAVQI